MELIEDLNQIKAPFNNAVITIGNFDGVHKGHQTLLQQVIETGRRIGGTCIAMTFEPHPVKSSRNFHPPVNHPAGPEDRTDRGLGHRRAALSAL